QKERARQAALLSDRKECSGMGPRSPPLPLILMCQQANTRDKSLALTRYMIMKNPELEFCGYTTTHPSESKINLRIQTRGSLPAIDPFQRGLNELMNVCQHVLDKFEASIKESKDQRASRHESTF
uniref:DNA-directed RNA polymerase RBP11-like dimerisation domain-containing protein n=1 Tax=Suricata suricatta TaxID=37032 RepID=A0A673UIR7_SURSU